MFPELDCRPRTDQDPYLSIGTAGQAGSGTQLDILPRARLLRPEGFWLGVPAVDP